jgi:hypothetical protein
LLQNNKTIYDGVARNAFVGSVTGKFFVVQNGIAKLKCHSRKNSWRQVERDGLSNNEIIIIQLNQQQNRKSGHYQINRKIVPDLKFQVC